MIVPILISLCVLIVSVIVAEIVRGYTALWQGDSTPRDEGRLTFNPVPHLDPVGTFLVPGLLILLSSSFLFAWAKPMPYNPYNLRNGAKGELLVLLSSIGTHLFFVLLFTVLYHIRIAISGNTQLLENIFTTIILLNIVLIFIRLLPIPLMDGYKIISLLLPTKQRNSFTLFQERMLSQFSLLAPFVIIFIFIFFLAGPLFALAQFLTSVLITL